MTKRDDTEGDRWTEKIPDYSASTLSRVGSWSLDVARPLVFSRGPPRRLGPLSYLDGVRGFMALIVYWTHHQLWARIDVEDSPAHIFQNAWGYEGNYYFACLPGIRTFFTGGHFAATTFCVISGYVLSARPMSLIHAGQFTALEEGLASAMFRRWLRLHLPAIGVILFYCTLWHLFGIWPAFPDPQFTWFEELGELFNQYTLFSFPWRNTDYLLTYNYQLWSIAVEFWGSVITITTLLAFSRCRSDARLFCELGLMYYFMYIVDGWYGSAFVAGLFLCEVDKLATSNDLPFPRLIARLEGYKNTIYYLLFLAGIYLSGVPTFNSEPEILRDSPGWYYLSFFRPLAATEYRFLYLFLAASFLIFLVPRIPWLKSLFETRFSQYLGRISYALYLVHGPLMWTFADRVYAAVGWPKTYAVDDVNVWSNFFPLPTTGPLGLELAFLLPHLIILPLTLWVAEMVTKVFDEPSIRFSHWAYKRMFLGS